MQKVLGSVYIVYNKKLFSTDIVIQYIFVFWYNFKLFLTQRMSI